MSRNTICALVTVFLTFAFPILTGRPRFETPILLVGKGTAAQFRAPEVKTRAAARPRVPHQGVIHQFVGAPAARRKRSAAPIGHHRAAPVKAEHTRHRPAAIDRKSTRLNSSH